MGLFRSLDIMYSGIYLKDAIKNINPIVRYGVLIYGCSNSSNLKKFYLQTILKFNYFRRRSDHSADIFIKHKILFVYELLIYELL